MAVKIPVGMLSLLQKKPEVKDDSSSKAQAPVAKAHEPVASPLSNPVPSVTGSAVDGGTAQGARPADVVSTQVVGDAGVSAASEAEKTPAQKFRESLDQLDSLLTKDFDAVSLALSRDVVKRVMIELRTFPEFNGIVQDNDVKNIFIFLRRAVEGAKESGTEKKDKKVAKAKKAGAIVVNVPDSLEMLGNFDTSKLEAILGIGKKK